MDAAIATEALKLRRSPVARTGWLAVVLGVPALTAALTAAARAGGDSQLAVKAAAMLTGTGLAGYLGIVGQVTTVAMLVTTGIVTAWCFGREFVDGTVAGLFAATVSRRRIAAAKFVVMILWSLTACTAIILVAVLAGALLGLGPPTGDAWRAAGMDLAAGTLMAALALPLAWVASARRGYLPAVAALLLIVVATQIITALGAGGWFPYAAPHFGWAWADPKQPPPSGRPNCCSPYRSAPPGSGPPPRGGTAPNSPEHPGDQTKRASEAGSELFNALIGSGLPAAPPANRLSYRRSQWRGRPKWLLLLCSAERISPLTSTRSARIDNGAAGADLHGLPVRSGLMTGDTRGSGRAGRGRRCRHQQGFGPGDGAHQR